MLDNIATRVFMTVERLAGPRTANRVISILGREVQACTAACGWCRIPCANSTCNH